jgi:hypothetical protein
MNERERKGLMWLALAAPLVGFVPLLGLEHIIFTKPILAGVLVAWFVRRFALHRVPAVLVVVVPVVVLMTIGVLLDSDASAGYRAVVWIVMAAMYLAAASIGAMVGNRPLARRQVS